MISQAHPISRQSAHEAEARQAPVSVIIPSLSGNTADLLQALHAQSLAPAHIQVVRGVRPNGRARNQGVASLPGSPKSAAQAETILIFIDDDALPVQSNLLETLVAPLLEDETIGITGAARVLPPGATRFQRRVAREIPRTVNQVPQQPLETNPPLDGYGHSLITTTCCALRRSVFEQAGGFDESLTSGVDTDFFYRVRSLGYRFVMAPGVFVEHPAPGSLITLIKKYHWYGVGYGQETRRRPQQKMGPRLPTHLHRAIFLLAVSIWLLPNMFFLYSFGYPRLEFGFRPLKALSTYAVAWGYARAWHQSL